MPFVNSNGQKIVQAHDSQTIEQMAFFGSVSVLSDYKTGLKYEPENALTKQEDQVYNFLGKNRGVLTPNE